MSEYYLLVSKLKPVWSYSNEPLEYDQTGLSLLADCIFWIPHSRTTCPIWRELHKAFPHYLHLIWYSFDFTRITLLRLRIVTKMVPKPKTIHLSHVLKIYINKKDSASVSKLEHLIDQVGMFLQWIPMDFMLRSIDHYHPGWITWFIVKLETRLYAVWLESNFGGSGVRYERWIRGGSDAAWL